MPDTERSLPQIDPQHWPDDLNLMEHIPDYFQPSNHQILRSLFDQVHLFHSDPILASQVHAQQYHG